MPAVCRSQGFGFGVAVLLVVSPCHPVTLSPCHAFDEVIDSPMYRSPDLTPPRLVPTFPAGLKGLWLRALERPEVEMRRKAAETIARGQVRGVKGLQETVVPLRAALDRQGQHPTVRLAAAQALIALEAREAAGSLLRHAQSGDSDLRDLIEPALAQWDYRPARAVWLARLRDPDTPNRPLVLAIRLLASVREEQAADRLGELVNAAHTPDPLRLEAARALGQLRDTGLEKDAGRLAGDASPRGLPARLAAAALLRRHRGEAAVALLQRLTRDPEPAVAAAAAGRLLEIDPNLLAAALDGLLASPDAALRTLAVETLFRAPGEKQVRLLADRLDDPHPGVRRKARRALEVLAVKGGLRSAVIAAGVKVLGGAQWRGLEQSVILLTELDHKPAAGRLVELLTFERPEVSVSAAWGLRKLAVAETLPPVVRYLEGAVKQPLLGGPRGASIDHQLSQLLQLVGTQKYAAAEPLLRRLVPKQTWPPPESRAAAVWSLGLIHEGKVVPALADELVGRLNDTAGIPPEDDRVRWMSALTLGRMKARDSLESLRMHSGGGRLSQDPVSNACGWAIEQITGVRMVRPETEEVMERDWFLVPDR